MDYDKLNALLIKYLQEKINKNENRENEECSKKYGMGLGK